MAAAVSTRAALLLAFVCAQLCRGAQGAVDAAIDTTFFGHHLLSVRIDSQAHLKTLLDVKDNLDLDFWSHAIKEGHTGLVRVPPESFNEIVDVMESAGIQYYVNSDNLQSLVNEEKRLIAPDDASATRGETASDLLDYARYYSYKSLVSRHQERTSEVSEIFNYEWRVIPCLNPDGYEFSRRSNRMWRKNRSVQYSSNGTKCYGTDLNRNFDVSFCSTPDEADPCKETFCGKAPFSEPESHAFREYVTEFRNRIAFYFSFHAFGDLWLIPYSFRSERPPDYDELMARANRAVAAIQEVSGTLYKAGSISSLLYIAPGTAIDWMYVKKGVRMSFTIEISSEKNGFFLNQSNVIDVPKQAWVGVVAAIQ
ncbi:carboxypeptidase A1-like isoform X2 [Dermacentor albipictus]|uniref:carboxypeptidase A1-like isoform X2 n=1 Tax=Dermacentor albipictus TaxID=60249 RepID=UPI0031FBF7D1